jgi:SAM-dependent methyltransferase
VGARVSAYDGSADWYDEHCAAFTLQATAAIRKLVGPGGGRCLDVGCGTGLHLATLVDLGWAVVGVDSSGDQLRRARERAGDKIELVEADATDLPFPDDTFDAVLTAFTHTDIDDFGALLRETARVLRPRGRLAFVGLHPCFVGPHARFVGDDDPPELHPGYDDRRRRYEAPGVSPEGLRARVGAVHLPLGELMQAFLSTGFSLHAFEELGDGLYPRVIAIGARNSAG